jgi:hypothetical protein
MPIELHRLNLQLQNLKALLEDAVKKGEPFMHQVRISKQITGIEQLIEKRKEFLSRQDRTN